MVGCWGNQTASYIHAVGGNYSSAFMCCGQRRHRFVRGSSMIMMVELTFLIVLLASNRTPGLDHHAPAVNGLSRRSRPSCLESIQTALSSTIILLLVLAETR